jgi:hypothetical protein
VAGIRESQWGHDRLVQDERVHSEAGLTGYYLQRKSKGKRLMADLAPVDVACPMFDGGQRLYEFGSMR